MRINASNGMMDNGNVEYNANNIPTVNPINNIGTYIPTAPNVVSPMGVNFNNVAAVKPSATESVLDSIISTLPDSVNSTQAINNLKALVQNRKLSVEKNMDPVTKVFTEKVTNGLYSLLNGDYQAFDRVVDKILSTNTPDIAAVGVNNKSKYTGNNTVDNHVMELMRAAVNFMRKQNIVNVGNMGKFNKILTDMVAETKSKKFSEVITKVPITELWKTFKAFVGGVN